MTDDTRNVSRGDVTGTPAPWDGNEPVEADLVEPFTSEQAAAVGRHIQHMWKNLAAVTSEPTVSTWHDAAMRAADSMLEAREEGDELMHLVYAEQAFALELSALRRAADLGVSEATRTILFRSMVALGREAFSVSRPDLTGETPPASESLSDLEWLESKLTLHNGVELLYVVDGYEVLTTTHDGNRVERSCRAATLSAAIQQHRNACGGPPPETTREGQ